MANAVNAWQVRGVALVHEGTMTAMKDDRLISLNAVIDELEERIRANGYSNVALVSELNRSIGYIMRLPSAQKKGHWIDEGTNYSCSECHRGCWVNSDYCPWCGAMNGKDGNGNV